MFKLGDLQTRITNLALNSITRSFQNKELTVHMHELLIGSSDHITHLSEAGSE